MATHKTTHFVLKNKDGTYEGREYHDDDYCSTTYATIWVKRIEDAHEYSSLEELKKHNPFYAKDGKTALKVVVTKVITYTTKAVK